MNRFPLFICNAGAYLPRVLIALLASLFFATALNAAPLSISNIPLEAQSGVAPNVLLTIDSSGSMGLFYLPNSPDNGTLERDASSDYNKLYYNPTVDYVSGISSLPALFPNQPTYNNAYLDVYGVHGCSPSTINLSSQYVVQWVPSDVCTTGSGNGYYYTQDTSLSTCTSPPTGNGCFTKTDMKNGTAAEQLNFAYWFTYFRSRMLMAKTTATLAFASQAGNIRVALQDLKPGTSTLASAINHPVTNFTGTDYTNFFTNLRSEAPGGITPLREALIRAGKYFSLAAGTAGDPYVTNPGTSQTASQEYSCRANFNIMITDGYWNGSSSNDNLGFAYNDNKTVTLPSEAVATSTSLFGVPSTSYTPALPYSDNAAGTENDLDGTTSITTLSDIAFYYWSHDLRSDLSNNVKTYTPDITTAYSTGSGSPSKADIFNNPANDPAAWQHMVNFTIPLGLIGDMNYDDTNLPTAYIYPFGTPGQTSPPNSPTTGWSPITSVPDSSTASDNNAKIDDLWHAAINSRGGFYPATDPTSLVASLTNILNSISNRVGSASALAVSGNNYQAGTMVFQPSYNTIGWTGELTMFPNATTLAASDVCVNGTPSTVNGAAASASTICWNASNTLATQNYNPRTATNPKGRTILTYDPTKSKGVAFEYGSIPPTTLKTYNLDPGTQPLLLNYLRGDKTYEINGPSSGTFRDRTTLLGDIIHSTPVYVGKPNQLIPDSLEKNPYSAFVTKYANRTPTVWVGGNDGMLHGFDTSDGTELMAYVPFSVYPNLASLASPTYTHKYFVDGTPYSTDVFFDSSFGGDNAWHTVLVGGLNAGGQGIYALDVTDPANFSESNPSDVLWEFTDADDSDLGYTYSKPQVQKMNNGEWMTIFGNGYNNTAADGNVSSSGDAVLYLLDMQKGPNVVKSPCGQTGISWCKLDTLMGSVNDPTGAGRPNGLSTVTTVDVDGNYTVDYIYAGDLYGNIWKFDVSSSDPTKWHVATDSTGKPAPLFIATDASGNHQPITTAPIVVANPTRYGYMVDFGTGKYIESSDLTSTAQQSFYGVWDREEPTNNITTIGSQSSTGRQGRTSLYEQKILATDTSTFTKSNARITTNDSFNWYLSTTGGGLPPLATTTGPNSYLGWYMDLDANGSTPAERVNVDPQSVDNRVIFITNTPTGNACAGGNSSWIMELSADQGSRPLDTVFDYNDNGVIDNFSNGSDSALYGGVNVVGSGYQLKGGTGLAGFTRVNTSDGNEVKLLQTGNGQFQHVKERGSFKLLGRRAWTELLPN